MKTRIRSADDMPSPRDDPHRYRCEDGRLLRHDPQHDDPYLETHVGTCPECGGWGCDAPDTASRAMHDALTGACRGAGLSGLGKGRAI